jgi:hypothetical protein
MKQRFIPLNSSWGTRWKAAAGHEDADTRMGQRFQPNRFESASPLVSLSAGAIAPPWLMTFQINR